MLRAQRTSYGNCGSSYIKVRCQQIDDLFQTLDFLNLVEKQIGLSIKRYVFFQFCIYIYRFINHYDCIHL